MGHLRRTVDDWAEQEQLLRVAWGYYVDGMTQDDIAKRINVSRASAGRLLERCRQSGLVSFTINSDYYSSFKVGRRLRDAFTLREALVLPELDEDMDEQPKVNARLGRGGAQYLQNHLRSGDVLAMGWGDTVQQTMEQLQPDALAKVRTVSLTGGVGSYLNNLRRVRADRDHGMLDAVLPTPILASSENLAVALRAETQVQEVLQMSRQADHALLGVGALTGNPTLSKLGYASKEELAENALAGAVGDLLGVFYDAQGRQLDLALHRRRIGVELDDLRRIPNVVGVAGGRDKVNAIRGALRGGYLDVLVTTEAVARELLDEGDTA